MLKTTMRQEAGFTIIELIIVIMIIGILATLSVVRFGNVLVSSRDDERADDTASIVRKLEQDYSDRVVGSPAYPPMNQFVSDTQNGTGTAGNIDTNAYRAPGQNSSSVTAASNANDNDPKGPNTPALNEYVYQAFSANGSPCKNTGDTCVRFRLYYRKESDNSVVILRSLHQQ